MPPVRGCGPARRGGGARRPAARVTLQPPLLDVRVMSSLFRYSLKKMTIKIKLQRQLERVGTRRAARVPSRAGGRGSATCSL